MNERGSRRNSVGFIGMVAPRNGKGSEKHYRAEFFGEAKVEPQIESMMGKCTIFLFCDHSVSFACNEQESITCVVHGEIFGDGACRNAEWLTATYIHRGFSCLGEVDGSFVLLFIDRKKDLIAIATDRVNSRKTFYSQTNGVQWFSSSLAYHPVGGKRIDPVGLGYFLVNGAIYNRHTLFDGVSILDRASIYTVAPTGLHKSQYWTYEFTNRLSGVAERSLSIQLEELLVDGVRRSLGQDNKVLLSLSGGHDSRAILGILTERLAQGNLFCFSYALGEPKPGTDPYVAAETAKSLGLRCEIVQSYEGDLPEVILKNAALGQGISSFCDEMDAWENVSKHGTAFPKTILFVGEHSLGFINCSLDSFRDVLTVVRIQAMDQLSWLKGRLPSKAFSDMEEAVEEDLREIRKRCPPATDLHDTKDFLFLDQRLCHVMLPWRERICGHFFQVRFPFLSRDLLDFMKDVPLEWRLGKRLYKNTIKRMFPEIYRIPSATIAGYVPRWSAEFRIHRKAISDLIMDAPSRLDDLVPPQTILSLLFELTGWRGMFPFLKTLPGKAVLRTMKGKRTGNWLLQRFPVVDLKNLLKRLLTVRQVLSVSQ